MKKLFLLVVLAAIGVYAGSMGNPAWIGALNSVPASSGGGFDPLSLNPMFLYSADTITVGNNTPIAANDWQDQSGYGHHIAFVSTPAPTNFTSAINSHNAVQFLAGNSIYCVANLWPNGGTNIAETFVVASWSATLPVTGFPGCMTVSTNGSGVGNQIYLANLSSNLGSDSASKEWYPANPQSQSVFFMARNETESTQHLDELLLGVRGGVFWSGRIAYAIGFKDVLTSPQRASMFTYLGTRFGITYP